MSNTTKLLMIICFSLLTHSARATTTTANMSVTATVVSSCSITASSLDFGTIGPASSELTNSSALTVNCTNGTPYTIRLDAGKHAGSDITARSMKHTTGTSTLTYQLYKTTARDTVWGDTTDTGVPGSGSGSAQTVNVYGKLNTVTNAAVGTYTDDIVVSIDF